MSHRDSGAHRNTQSRRLPFWSYVSGAFGAFGLGYGATQPEHTAVAWAVAVVILVAGVWRALPIPRTAKLAVSVCLIAAPGLFGHIWYRDATRPTFVFVAPGVWLNHDRWLFLVRHRGRETAYKVEILFEDEDRKNHLTSQPALTPSELSSFMTLLRFPEINPAGRGPMFATSFQWKPFAPLHSRFRVEIGWRDGAVSEKIEIQRFGEEWAYAVQVFDRASRKLLLSCRDARFGGTPAEQCLTVLNENDR